MRAPLTSFDWNTVNVNRIATCSLDTTCTIWDIEAGNPITQIIAHDQEVFDISFSPKHENYFASVGGDGSLRLFDMR